MKIIRLSVAFLSCGLIYRSVFAAQVGMGAIDTKTFSGIVRCTDRCDPHDAVDLGMRITGSTPVFDQRFQCPDLDEGWAIDYSGKRGRPALHGGIDIPAHRGTPILAVADGVVAAMFDNHETAVGVRLFLRHSPEQTGKPFWVYSEYAHLLELPPLAVGQKVKRGDEVGKTSNTGISGKEARERITGSSFRGPGRERRNALHFSIMYSDSPDYAVLEKKGGYLIPVRGRWMDPVAFYRSQPPYNSDALAALPETDKQVPIPCQDSEGKAHQPNTKLIWPYSCSRR